MTMDSVIELLIYGLEAEYIVIIEKLIVTEFSEIWAHNDAVKETTCCPQVINGDPLFMALVLAKDGVAGSVTSFLQSREPDACWKKFLDLVETGRLKV